jgi:tetratricopeptide (TPR) repeat protein
MSMSFDSSIPELPLPDRNAATKLAALEYCELGGNLLAADKYAPAKSAYQLAIDCDPKLAIAHSGFAQACYNLGEYAVALLAIDLAIDLNPQELDCHDLRTLIVQALNNFN